MKITPILFNAPRAEPSTVYWRRPGRVYALKVEFDGISVLGSMVGLGIGRGAI